MPDPKVTKKDRAIQEALRRIEKCRDQRSAGITLDLSASDLETVPPEIGQLTALRELHLYKNQLTTLPPEIGQLTALQKLYLSDNPLTSLPPEIGRLKALQILHLDDNSLTSLPPEIGQLAALQELYLSDNQLTGLPREIGWLTGLRVLNLSNNQLTGLPREIGWLTGLQVLHFSNSQLTSVPPVIGRLTGLLVLHLSNNQLTSVPPVIGQLTGLQVLYLSDNQLTSLPPEIGHLGELQKINLVGNRLTSLPPEIGQLTGLLVLRLSKNSLTSVPPDIGRLKALQSLHLAENSLTSVPPEIGQLTALTKLYLGDNDLTNLPSAIGQLKALQGLDAAYNPLTSLPPEIGQLKALEGLLINNSSLTSLPPEIGQLTALQGLILNNNALKSLPPEIGQLKALQRLDLNYNQLTSLPPQIGQLTALQELDLAYNQLTSLPPEIGQIETLKALYLHENPALSLPDEILGPSRAVAAAYREKPKHPAEVLDYYFAQRKRALDGGMRPLNEAKVLVLGEAKVGKSSLILALTEGKLRQPLGQTHGIVQKAWALPLRDGRLAKLDEVRDESLQLNLWDFGGQEVYHSTHTFFLTRRAVYLIVADARGNDRQNNLEYWLQMATSFGAGAPIWVVVNKCDEHGAGPDEHALRRKFPAIRDFLRTSCWTGEGLDKLRSALAAEALDMEGVRQQMNNLWLGIKHQLELLKCDTLTLEEYAELCREQGETEPGRPEKLLDLWDKLGTVRYFPTRPDDPPAMRDTAILNPEWVTKAVYAVLDDAKVRAAGGLATESDFARILTAGGYPAARHQMIEHVMRRFDLLYDTPDHKPLHYMLVPQLLPDREPEHQWPVAPTLSFIYRYPVLPAALVPGFIARRHRFLSPTLSPWRHGCVLHFPEKHVVMARARVIGDAGKKEVTLSVTGDPISARDALDAMRATFEEMHGAIEGLHVEELIPVPGRPDAPTMSYRQLRAYDLNGVEEYQAPGATPSELIRVNVREVLNAMRGPVKANAERVLIQDFRGANISHAVVGSDLQDITI